MTDRVRAGIASLAGALMMGVATGGCTAARVGNDASRRAGSTDSSTPLSSVPSASPTFQPGEIRSVPDPRTLLTPALRKDLRFDKDSACKREKGSRVVDPWSCYLLTRTSVPGTVIY